MAALNKNVATTCKLNALNIFVQSSFVVSTWWIAKNDILIPETCILSFIGAGPSIYHKAALNKNASVITKVQNLSKYDADIEKGTQ